MSGSRGGPRTEQRTASQGRMSVFKEHLLLLGGRRITLLRINKRERPSITWHQRPACADCMQVALLTPRLYEWLQLGVGVLDSWWVDSIQAEHLETRTLTGNKQGWIIYWVGGSWEYWKASSCWWRTAAPSLTAKTSKCASTVCVLRIIHIHLFMMATDLIASPVKTQQGTRIQHKEPNSLQSGLHRKFQAERKKEHTDANLPKSTSKISTWGNLCAWFSKPFGFSFLQKKKKKTEVQPERWGRERERQRQSNNKC